MPNWCSNTITITGDKKIISGMTRLIESIKKTEGEEPGVFHTLIGRDSRITQEKYDNGDWYNSNVERYGCKWDVSYDDCCFTLDEESISLHPETAWSPPIEFCKSMVKEYKSIKIHIFYSEGGNDFCGQCDIYLDEEGIVCCDEEDYGYSEGLYHLDIDGFWGEVESMVDSYCCEEEKSAEEFVEDNYSYVSEEDKKEIIEMFNEQKEIYAKESESNN
jgi:hypothetical protein